MIYIFDKKQTIIKVLTNEDLTAGHLDLKINTATTFEFSLPANKPLPSNAKYVAVPHPLNGKKFILLRLTERTDNADTIDYSAYELAYQELATDGYIADKRPSNQDALTLMKTALNGSNWELNNVNVAGTASTNFYYIDHLTAISKVVELLGGEIVFYVEIQGNTISGRYMDYLARQGEDTSKVFANGSNLLTIERQSDTSGVYTAILPRGKGVQVDGDNDVSTPDGYGRRLNIADAVWKKSSGKPLDKPAGEIILRDPTANAEWGHINGNYRLLLETYDDIDDVNTLINSAYKMLQAVNHPKIQYSATIAEVGGLSLGDTVLIMHGERDLSYKTRVFEVDYDLLDPAQTQISLGDDLSSNSITSQINSVSSSQSIASEQTQWTINQVGRDSVTFGTEYPENPKVLDTFFKYLPNGDTVIYEWNGEIWEEKASTHTGADISAAIDDAISKANKYTDELNEKQASEAAAFQSEANVALSSAVVERADMFKQSTSMATSAATHADSMANSAAAYGKAQAASALSNANAELASAKKELGSEVSKAQSDIIVAQNELAGKVSQTDFNKKTGELNTQYGQVKATADSVTTDVANYKKSNDGRIKADEANIDANSKAIALKVSQVDYDANNKTINGKFAQQIIDSNKILDSVTELQASVNSLGQVNQLMNTEFNPDLEGWNVSGTKPPYKSYVPAGVGSTSIGFWTLSAEENTYHRLWQTLPIPSISGGKISLSWRADVVQKTNYNHLFVKFADKNGNNVFNNANNQVVMVDWDNTGSANSVVKLEGVAVPDEASTVTIDFEAREGTRAYLSQPMLVFSETIGDYVAGNYNNNARVTALELDINGIHGLVDDPQKGLSATWNLAGNGQTIAVQAQKDATMAITTAKGLQTTIDDNKNDLQAQITATAKQFTTEITDRTNGDKSVRTDMAKLIDQRVSSVTTGYETAISQSATAITLGISKPNQFLNTEFNPDLEGWETNTSGNIRAPYRSYWQSDIQGTVVGWNTLNGSASSYSRLRQDVRLPSTPGAGHKISISWYSYTGQTDFYNNLWLKFYDNAGNVIADANQYANWADRNGHNPSGQNSWTVQNKWEGIEVPDTAVMVNVSFEAREGTSAYLGHPMLVFGPTIGPYMPGSYSGMNSSTVLQLFKDNWGIGLADNIGKITSGIIGDKNSLNLINNNIVLQGNTTVTADFYAKGGNFKNLNASNITTGTINAAKINVINLDVSSLSGNITNFIKSYWNNAYQNLTIDANAINFSTANSRTMIGNNIITMWNNSKGYYRVGGLLTLQYNTGTDQDHTTGIYLNLDQWHTTNQGDSNWNYGGPDFFGGSEIGISHTTGRSGNNIQYGILMKWANGLAASRDSGAYQGFNFYDQTTFWRPIYSYNGKKFSFGDINGVPAIFIGSGLAGVAGNDTELYFFNKQGYISLTDIAKKVGVGPAKYESHLAW